MGLEWDRVSGFWEMVKVQHRTGRFLPEKIPLDNSAPWTEEKINAPLDSFPTYAVFLPSSMTILPSPSVYSRAPSPGVVITTEEEKVSVVGSACST
jgi:hypothetical protein